MFEFLEDLKKYLDECFKKDTSITASKKPLVYSGYQIQHEPSSKKPEIQVQLLSNAEQTNYTTFCGKNANSTPVQISALTGPLRINGIELPTISKNKACDGILI